MTVVYSSKFHSLTKNIEKSMATILGWNSLYSGDLKSN